MPHVLPAALGAAALVLPAPVSGAAPAEQTRSAHSAVSYEHWPAESRAKEKKYERKVRIYTNKARKKHDRKSLHRTKCVDRFADRWARKMARRQVFQHQDLGPILRKCDLNRVGENIAAGYDTGKSVVRGWMHSTGHRANILEPRYRQLGVGMARDEHGVPWVSQVFGRG